MIQLKQMLRLSLLVRRTVKSAALRQLASVTALVIGIGIGIDDEPDPEVSQIDEAVAQSKDLPVLLTSTATFLVRLVAVAATVLPYAAHLARIEAAVGTETETVIVKRIHGVRETTIEPAAEAAAAVVGVIGAEIVGGRRRGVAVRMLEGRETLDESAAGVMIRIDGGRGVVAVTRIARGIEIGSGIGARRVGEILGGIDCCLD